MYAVLHLPAFALQAVLRNEPAATGRPAALFSDQTKKSMVLVANAAAAARGIVPGLTAPQSVARCADLLIRIPQPAAEAEARSALLATGFMVSPMIEDTAPGVCTIELKGIDRSLYRHVVTRAVAQLQALGFDARGGVAATPLLALYAARAAVAVEPSGGNAESATQALLPLNVTSTPDATAARVRVVTDAATFLGPLPIATADPPPAVATLLADWGIVTLEQLTALGRDAVGRRLGPDGLALWHRAGGGEPRPLHPVVPPQTFNAAMTFEHEIETLEPLLFILRRLLERLTLELRAAGHVAAELTLTLAIADETRHERVLRLPEPTLDVDVLFRALTTHLETLRTDASIAAANLRITPTRPLVRQQGLFETGLRDPHGFSETLARLTALVGPDRVGTPQREDTFRPDAVRLRAPPTVVPPPAPAPAHPTIGLPLRRFRPPLPARLELSEGRPTFVWTERFSGPVAEYRGPWLSSGDWWQADRAWRRTEYDVALATGGLYRLVLTARQWLIEGEYD